MGANPQYLTVTAYSKNSTGKSSQVGEYKAMLNPEKYHQDFTIDYSKAQASGSPNAVLKFEKMTPSKMNFDLVFDATGVVNSSVTDAGAEVQKFLDLAYNYNGDIHSPNYLKLSWGKALSYICRLSTAKVDYTLFKPNGTPLRAKVAVSFEEYTAPVASPDESPDMTHVVRVVSGDLLPTLTDNVYDDSGHLLKVAAYNKLDSLIHLQAGDKLYFPPLAKS